MLQVLFLIPTIASACFAASCFVQICVSALSIPKILLYRWFILLASIMTTSINIIVLINGSQLTTQSEQTLCFVCKFFRALSIIILISLSIPFMTDIFYAATESSHLFYKKNSSSTKHNNGQNNSKQSSHIIVFKQSITKHKNVMRYVAVSCRYIGIFGSISYLILEIVSWTVNVMISRIISYYLTVIIAIIFAICTMFHHLRLYQHMNTLHHFILTAHEKNPSVIRKFVRTKKRLLFISIASMILVIIFVISLIMSGDSGYTHTSYRSSAFYQKDIGYFAYIWIVMLYQMIFHVWCFQSVHKIPGSSFASCFCHCMIQKDIKNLEHNVDKFNEEQQEKEQDPTYMRKIMEKLEIQVVIEDKAGPQSHQNKAQNINDILNHLDLKATSKHCHQLTPYNAPGDGTPSTSAGGSYSSKTKLEIDVKHLNNINVVIYNINVLLSLAYTTQDALELIQNNPIEWMTNNFVKNRIFNFEHKRTDLIRHHLEYIRNKGHKKICIISNGFDDLKMKTLIDMVNAKELLDIVHSKDDDKWNHEKNNLSVIILDIMAHFECNNDQVLFVSNELEQMKYLKQIGLCSLYPLYSIMDDVQIPNNLTARHINELNKHLTKDSNV